MNRMYYACFSAANALLIHDRIDGVKTHDGTRIMFFKHYIAENIFERRWSKFYQEILNCRTAADYEEFIYYTAEDCLELLPDVKAFIYMIDDYLRRHPLVPEADE